MKLFSLLISLLFLFNINAQTITNYTTADGLMDNFVECVNVDVDDNIWFGTSVGFQKYDPSTSNVFLKLDQKLRSGWKIWTTIIRGLLSRSIITLIISTIRISPNMS